MGMAWCKRVLFPAYIPCAGSHLHSSVRGLSNCGLSCCINALLQTFAATPELEKVLSRWQPSERSDENNIPLELKRALEAMKDKRQSSPHLDFLNCLHKHNICRFINHDADEVFHIILNLIQKQMSDQQIAAEIKDLYKISVEECTECVKCGNVHRTPNIFLSFPLPLHDDGNTLEDCFRNFFKPQRLEDSEAFYCVKCEKKMSSSQSCKLVSVPSILCINLKRFRSFRGYTRKLDNKISFPETLNMAEILPEEHSQLAERKYRLYGVVVHIGMPMVGHYTAYICSTDSNWYYIDDSHTRQVSWEEVQSTYGGRERYSKTAYMLLYRRLSSEADQGANS